MNIDGVFLPVAAELIDQVFPTAITYVKVAPPTYDPATGDITVNETQYAIKAGVLSRGRVEAGGVSETYELRLWIHHGLTGLPLLPTTGDVVEYDDIQWKVTTVDPTYSSKDLIASKITALAQ